MNVRVWLAVVLLFAFVGCSGGSGGSSDESSDRLVIGAHYYMWFPQNFRAGYVRPHLTPPQEPLFGEYDSRSSAVAEQQIALAADYGVDFFTLDFWPTRPQQNAAMDSGLLQARNIGRIKFAMFYETIDLGFDESRLMTVIDETAKDKFVADMVRIATKYFSHPSYLRIKGRPVVFFYVSRTLVGSYRAMFREARSRIKELGFDPFFVGDEIYWINSIDGSNGPEISTAPNVDRIRLFDAITSYNVYAPPFVTHSGYASISSHLSETQALYQRYRDLVPEIPIIPGLLPGYNDRGHRLSLDHYVIAREYSPGAGQGSLLREYYNQIGAPFLDPELRMVAITSWNEWNEETAIEPTVPGQETSSDDSGGSYTQGYRYGGSGFEALETVREISAAGG